MEPLTDAVGELTGTDEDIYLEHGYANRKDYLKNLAEDNDIELTTVELLADMLGPSEDFDGLVIAVEDFVESSDF